MAASCGSDALGVVCSGISRSSTRLVVSYATGEPASPYHGLKKKTTLLCDMFGCGVWYSLRFVFEASTRARAQAGFVLMRMRW